MSFGLDCPFHPRTTLMERLKFACYVGLMTVCGAAKRFYLLISVFFDSWPHDACLVRYAADFTDAFRHRLCNSLQRTRSLDWLEQKGSTKYLNSR